MSIFNSIRFPASGRARLGIMIIGLLWLGAPALRADRYVTTNGTGDSSSWGNATSNIQWAVNAAVGGETVWVSNGTYCLTNQIEVMNNITVKSTNGYSNTLVYAGWPTYTTRCFYVTRTGIVDGFTISNGHYVHTNDTRSGGGGAWVATNGRIQNCYFVNNICSNGGTDGGGGGALVQRYGIVSNCTFYSNTIYKYITGTYTGTDYNYGGGIFVYDGLAVDCRAISNYLIPSGKREGAGIAVMVGTLSNCFCADNTGSGLYGGGGNIIGCVISNNTGYGAILEGGIWKNCLFINNGGRGGTAWWSCWLTNCVITGNRGGGLWGKSDLYNNQAYPMRADGCAISNNTYSGNGAGCYFINGVILRNCLIHHNTNTDASSYGGGIYLDHAATSTNGTSLGYTTNGIFNCTIVDNYSANKGGGLAASGTNYIVNCVIASNRTAAAGSSYSNIYNLDTANSNYYFNCCAPVTNTDIFAPNQGNITADPQFVDSAAGNWRLKANSPCLNTGTNQSWMMNLYDLDGRARIRYRRVDMGAYETIYDGTIFTIP